jgi:hypothetical protein
VIVQALPDGNIEVAVVDPISSMQAVQNQGLGEMDTQVQQKLKNVINNT